MASAIFAAVSCAQEIDDSRLQAVEVSAQVSEAPPRITLVWPARSDSTGYRITKRNGTTWSEVASLPASATSWSDGNVAIGQRYEYRVVKETGWTNYIGQSYITAGIRANALEDAGKVLLLVRDNIASALGGELEQLRKDLIAEGWEVARQDVSASSAPPQVKSAIQSVWQADPSRLKAVILIGHVAVPYSGSISPDGHTNHHGAWPADGYYADVDGAWTDSSVNSQVSEREVNWNVPGDGKFDQSTFPSAVDVAVGRIDFFEMTCFANKTPSRSEIDLTRQYLNKNHQFRSGQVQVTRRGFVLDNFGLREWNGVAATGWRNFAAFFGSENVTRLPLNGYFSRLSSESALCTWGAGGGSYYYCSGVGTSDDFALTDVNVVFSLWLGSYFGDWNNESNWLKAALGSGKILVSIYAGIPHSLFHNMALGGTVGDAFVLTENNRERDAYFPDSQGLYEVHQALLGDPTLRLFPQRPVSSFSAQGAPGKANLNWTASSGQGYVGAHVYRGTSANGPFTRVTTSPVTANSFADTVTPGTYAYMVRPVWLDASASGSFYNLGQGSVAANVVVSQDSTPTPTAPTLSIRRSSNSAVTLTVHPTAGVPVTIEYTENFGSWSNAGTYTSADGSPLTFDLPISGEERIYRARH